MAGMTPSGAGAGVAVGVCAYAAAVESMAATDVYNANAIPDRALIMMTR
jgi:hypothetical protein